MRVLGEPLSTARVGRAGRGLDLTVNAQPALLAASMAILAVLRERWREAGVEVRPRSSAGHSMGQYSAMVAAGALSTSPTRCGSSGSAAGSCRHRRRTRRDGARSSGSTTRELPELVAAGRGRRRVRRSPTATRPGRSSSAGERAAGRGRAATPPRDLGRASGRSCCPSASPPTRRSWPTPPTGCATRSPPSPFRDPGVAAPRQRRRAAARRPPTACRAELIDHLTRGVDWVRAVEAMADAGVDTFLEVGPGKVLTGLVSRIAPGSAAHRDRRSRRGRTRLAIQPSTRPVPRAVAPAPGVTRPCAGPTSPAASPSPASASSAPSATTSRPCGRTW